MFEREYALLDGVKIFIDPNQLDKYYAESYFLYRNHLNHLFRRIKIFQSYSNSNRKEYFKSLIEANRKNALNIKEIVNLLYPKVKLSAFENLRINATDNIKSSVLKDFRYLRRDWSYTNEGEYQVNLILTAIKEEFSKFDYENNNALFLGAGVGRLAFDCKDLYAKVYTTDKSFSMVWHLQKLLDGKSINFYNPKEKNVHKLENVAQKLTAKIPTDQLKNTNNKFETFVSDVFDLPFEEKSINSIFSIYFTDVIALKLWFGQIDQILSDNGLFIHFGPLDYFFSDEREMLTAEEFRLFFEQNGYETLVDRVVETPHLEDSNSISYRIYRNWFFIAQKKSASLIKQNIDKDTILYIKNPLLYERKGYLKEGVHETDTILKLPKGEFEGADSVIQILELVDGKNTFQEILYMLNQKGFKIDDPSSIKNLFLEFINQGVLSIKD